MSDYYDGPIWEEFGLTRAAYAVFSRRALQSMPIEWQAKFVALVREAHDYLPEGTFDGEYTVLLREGGKLKRDPMREYRHAGPIAPKGGDHEG